ncbi:MAG TPA: hypothetical protein VGW38_19275 [Chloroflexota bacterium]|nr:hypothetical protein [Chloroflexota bacterium]
MLSLSPFPREGSNIVFHVSPFAPPERMSVDEYRGYLRSLYRRRPSLFKRWARDARGKGYTIVDVQQDGLAEVLYEALCRVAEAEGFSIREPA